METATIVTMSGVSKQFPGTNALQDVNLQVRSGEIVGLVGKNGAGKSTLVKILMGLVKPDEGTILINGKNATHISSGDALNAGVAYIPQHVSLMESLSVAENILIDNLPTNKFGFIKWKKAYEEANQRLKALKVNLDVKKTVEGLTIAEQTMLAIAQALFRNARMIILDEPTVGIDPVLRKKIWDNFFELKKNGHTIIVTTHVMDEAVKCDRLGLIYGGDIIACDTVQNLLAQTKNNVLEELFFMQKRES